MRSDRAGDPDSSRSLINPATVIVVCAVALTFLGLSILFSASAWFKKGPYFYLNKQIIGVVVAAALCLVVSRLNLDYVRRYAHWIAGVCLVLLALVLIPHIGVWRGGARRWLGIGSFQFQISEFAKIGFVFCLAHYLALNQTRIGEFKRGFLWPLAIICGFAGLIVLEPDFGMAVFYFLVGLTLLFFAGAKWRYLIAMGLCAAVSLGALYHNPNRMRRLTEFWKEEPPYQVQQALIAYAAGGLDGAGLGRGRQQLSFLPEAHTDMIFAVIGEELGLCFTLGVVTPFAVMLCAGFLHLRRAPNLFHFLLVAGCLLFIAFQAVINLLSATGMIPPKGMSLPFVSAGLSNLLLMGVLLGIIVNTQRTWGRAALPSGAGMMREVMA